MPKQYLMWLTVVASFPGDFQSIDSAYVRLQDGHHYSNKKSSNATEIVCSSFGLITTLLCHSSSESSELISQLRDLLNTVDLSKMSVDKENKSKQRMTMCFMALGNANDTNKQDVIICGHDPQTVETCKELKKRMFPKSKGDQEKGRFEYSRKGAVDEPAKQLHYQGRT